MKKIIKYVLFDILRNRTVVAYTLFLLLVSLTVFNLEDNASKGILSLVNLVLIIIPLVSIVFSTIYVYNSSEFIELMVAQPLKRSTLWISIFVALVLAFSLSVFVGIGIPVLLYSADARGLTTIAAAVILSVIFVSIAMVSSVITRDKAKGIGLSIMLWFYFTLIYDGLILFVLFQFADYPMEIPMIVFTSLNPVDLARILILLKLDVSALMGYTGAVFQEFFGGSFGVVFSMMILLIWFVFPFWISARRFLSKDL